MESQIGFAVIGCGSAAIAVSKALAESPYTRFVLAQDLDAELARDLGDRFNTTHTTELDAVLTTPDVDAVYIAVPHHLLAPLARQVLAAGKHALVEKPMAIRLDQADDLIGLANTKQLTLGVFYEMRYAPGLKLARDWVGKGALGEIAAVRVQTLIDKPPTYWQAGFEGRSLNNWRGEKERAGGGVVLMNTSHLFDALWYVTGLRVTRVSGESAARIADVEVEDTAAAILRFENGAIGSLVSGAHIPGAQRGDECFEIYGTHGTLRVPDPYSSEPLQIYLRQDWDNLAARTWHTIPVTPVNVYRCAVDEFACAALERRPAPINGYDARRVLQIVLGIYQSAEEHRVVTLSNA